MGRPPLSIRQYMEKIQPISDQSWSQIEPHLRLRSFAKGESFAKRGRRETQFGILTKGIFKAYTLNEQGQESIETIFTPLHFCTAKSFVGALSALLTGGINQVQVEALTKADLWVAEYAQWQQLLLQNAELANWSLRMMEIFVVSKEESARELATLQAEQRYEHFLQRYPELEALIPQYEIARFLQISPTQLSRIRSARHTRQNR